MVNKQQKQASEAFWDKRAEEFNNAFNQKNKHFTDLMTFFKEKRLINSTSNILDIGCGPGKYAIYLAKHCQSVTAVDISENMLKSATKNAEQSQVSNVGFVKKFWEDVSLKNHGWQNKFDLVYALNCPGISSDAAVDKMSEASKKACFLCGFAKRVDLIGDQLKARLDLPQSTSLAENRIFLAFSRLWQQGFYPEVKYSNNYWEHTWPADYAKQIYLPRLGTQFEKSDKNMRIIDQFFSEKVENGMIKDRTDAKFIWLYWQVH